MTEPEGSETSRSLPSPSTSSRWRPSTYWLRRRAAARGGSAGDYERRDTIASLSMGVGSLVVPLIMPKLLRPFTLGRGRWGKAVVGVAAGAAVVTTGADLVRRRLAVSSDIENGQPPATTSAMFMRLLR